MGIERVFTHSPHRTLACGLTKSIWQAVFVLVHWIRTVTGNLASPLGPHSCCILAELGVSLSVYVGVLFSLASPETPVVASKSFAARQLFHKRCGFLLWKTGNRCPRVISTGRVS